MRRMSDRTHPQAGRRADIPQPTSARELGQVPERPVPVEIAVRGARAVLGKRFDYHIWFRGELVELKVTAAGHGFGVLRGADARINVYLPPRFLRNRDRPEEGSLVLVQGRLNIRPRGHELEIRASGPLLPTDLQGARAEARRNAERKLRAEGVLDRAHRALPRHPARVAVVTSVSSAAMRDVRATIRRRAPWVQVSLHGCIVQGRGAVGSILAGLDAAEASEADVVLLTRGGGAPDDYDPFDDPAVVRRVAQARLPIIVAVGHEGDLTLADLAADRAASTPTAAAELAVPDGEALGREVREHRRRLYAAARAICSGARARAQHERGATRRETTQRFRLGRETLRRAEPTALTATLRRRLRSERKRLESERDAVLRNATAIARERRRRTAALRPEVLGTHGEATIRTDRYRAQELRRAIHALSPERVLARGYALVLDGHGNTVRSSGQVRPGDTLRIRLHDGEVAAVVAGPPIQRPHQGEAT